MSKIVESYIELDDMFKKCHSGHDLSLDDLRVYRVILENFVKAARERYSDMNILDVSSALKLFFSDSAAQEELKQYETVVSDKDQKKHV